MILDNKRKIVALFGLPFAFLLTQCAENFDAPPVPSAPTVSEDVVSGLSEPYDVVIVPESAAAAAGKSLNHEDLLVANFEDSTIVQIDKSVEPHAIVPFADPVNDTTDLSGPTGIAFDANSINGDIYVSNFLDETGTTTPSSGGAIVVFNKDGALNRVINNPLFGNARGIVYDFENSTTTTAIFYVSNLKNNTILKVDVTAGSDTVSLYADMGFLGVRGLNPTQLAISTTEPHNLYAANTGLQTGEAPVGQTITILPTNAGTLPVPSSDIRVIASGEIMGPLSLDFDAEGRLFVAGHENGTVAMVDPVIGLRLASVETSEEEIQGMTAGEGGIYIATESGKVIEVDKSLLTKEQGGGHDDSGGHQKS